VPHDTVDSAVLLELCKSLVDLLAQLVITLLVGNGVLLLSEGIGKYLEPLVLLDELLSGLRIDDNCVYLALLQSLDSVSTLVIALNLCILNVLSKNIACCSQLSTDALPLKVICTVHCVFRSTAACEAGSKKHACGHYA